jgi:D-glycero-alpha-D-manno-heptose-7-phosphate kinase
MIISRTPHRISFFGGGTDYPSYYLKYGGKVLGVAVDKYCYLNVRKLPPFFPHKHRIVYSAQENVNSLDEIKHPSVREILKYLNIKYGVSIHHDGDIPAKSGMGSSSAFTVGLLKSMVALEGKIISNEQLLKDAIYVEQELIKENVGSQDQAFAAYGGLNLIEFSSSGAIEVNPVITDTGRIKLFEQRLMLFYTGISRVASEIAGEQIRNTDKNSENLHKMKKLVDESFDILVSSKRNIDEFGEMLNHTWSLKKTLSSRISNEDTDKLYEMALKAGAMGGKLLGAGGGGFMLLYVQPEKQNEVKNELSGYLHVPFKFDFGGSKILVYQP